MARFACVVHRCAGSGRRERLEVRCTRISESTYYEQAAGQAIGEAIAKLLTTSVG